MAAEPIINDKLDTLDTALDENHMRGVLTPLVEALHDRPVRIEELGVDILRRRNKRCVVRYRMGLRNGSPGPLKPFNLIGKVFKKSRGESVFSDMQELWSHGFRREESELISMPEPLAFLPDLCMLILEEIPGPAIKDALLLDPSPRYMRQLAQVLIKLHTCDFVPGPPFRMREHLLRCHPKFQVLQHVCPELEADIDTIVKSAIEIESGYSDDLFTAIHGDFHMGQIHVEDGRAYLIDFDALSYGDPAADLGNVLVFLKGKSRKMEEIPELIDVFFDEYFQHMDPAIMDRVPLYEAVTHLRRACKRLRFKSPRWEKKIERMIGAGLECIESVR